MMKRAVRKAPNMTKRVSMTNSSRKLGFGKSETKIDETTMWIGISILVFVLFIGGCYCNRDPDSSEGFVGGVKSGFGNLVEKFGGGGGGVGGSSIKELDVIYFMSPSCPWCQKMNKVLSDSGAMNSLTVVDVTKPEGQEMAKKMGAADKGIPAFISKKNKTGTIGFKQSVSELAKSLEKGGNGAKPMSKPNAPETPKMDPNQAVSAVQDLQIVVFASPSCGWCNKLKTELSEAGVLEMVELVDVSTEGGQQTAKELLGEFRGVPATYSRKTSKSSVGYKPLGDIINSLT
jgi:protein-disulfide isomerase